MFCQWKTWLLWKIRFIRYTNTISIFSHVFNIIFLHIQANCVLFVLSCLFSCVCSRLLSWSCSYVCLRSSLLSCSFSCVCSRLRLSSSQQIYKFHGFISNLCEIFYFIYLYCLNKNVVHYVNTKIMCTTFMRKQHDYIYNICV